MGTSLCAFYKIIPLSGNRIILPALLRKMPCGMIALKI
jgi:hypothetical protein